MTVPEAVVWVASLMPLIVVASLQEAPNGLSILVIIGATLMVIRHAYLERRDKGLR